MINEKIFIQYDKLTRNEKNYLYIKNRSIKKYFKNIYYNTNIEESINKKYQIFLRLLQEINNIKNIDIINEKTLKFINKVKKKCKIYKYIKKRSIIKDFQKIYFNKELEELCNNIEDKLPDYYQEKKEIKQLIKTGKFEELVNKYINIKEISDKINNISKRIINKNFIIEKLGSVLREINTLIKNIEIKYSTNEEDNGFLQKIFSSFKKKENNFSLEDFILRFKLNKIKIDKKIDLLNEYYKPNIQKEIIEREKFLNELEKIANELKMGREFLENLINNTTETEKKFDFNNKLQNILELENLILMNKKSIEIDIENLKNYLSIIDKLTLITRNAINTGVMLFYNNKISLKELYKNPDFEKYLENIEEIKLLTDVKDAD